MAKQKVHSVPDEPVGRRIKPLKVVVIGSDYRRNGYFMLAVYRERDDGVIFTTVSQFDIKAFMK